MTIPELIKDPNFLELLAAIAAAVWAWLRAQKWSNKRKAMRAKKALDALELGVLRTYETYTRAIKLASEDGSLTDAEKRAAYGKAIREAQNILTQQGLRLADIIPEHLLPLMVRKAVNLLLT